MQMKKDKLPQKNFGAIKSCGGGGQIGYSNRVGNYNLDEGYHKGKIEILWANGQVTENEFYVTTIFNDIGPYDDETTVIINYNDVLIGADLCSFAGKAKGRILSIEKTI